MIKVREPAQTDSFLILLDFLAGTKELRFKTREDV
jgi:hypothetical protein